MEKDDLDAWKEQRGMRGVGKSLQKVLSRFLNHRGVSGHYVAGSRPSWWLQSIPYRSPYKLGR